METPAPPITRPPLPTSASLAVGGALLGLAELIPFAQENDQIPLEALGIADYVTALFALPILVCALHGIAFLVVGKLLCRVAPDRALVAGSVVCAALFGAAWQDTLMHGDGIKAYEHYEAVRAAGFVVGPLILATFVAAMQWRRIPLLIRRIVGACVAIGGVVASHLVLPQYHAFHGFALLCAVATFGWLVAPALRGRRAAVACWTLTVAALVAPFISPDWPSAQRYTQRFSHAVPSLLSLPSTRPLELPPESVLDPDATFTTRQLSEIRRQLLDLRAEIRDEPRGENVLFVVLESTRADAWEDPKLAKRFHHWRSHGTYFPRAVAQYPATPLSYGAMFTSQTPSVLTQTPVWARSRLFDRIAPRFDHLILSRPANRWFDHAAITDFFVPRDADVMKHSHVNVGLRNIRKKLATIPDDESFFAWVHIYEPHQPWKRRHGFTDEKGKRGDYLSEVGFTDQFLGTFMKWFYAQPFADETLVVVIADHGEGLGERIEGKRYWGHHVHVHNVVSHIPAYFSGPGVPRGHVEEEVTVQHLDVMPTLFDFLGEELPPETFAQGTSLFHLLETKPDRDLVTEAFSIRGKKFFEFVAEVRDGEAEDVRERFREVSEEGKYAPKVGLQYRDHKLIRDMLIGRSALYDIAKDPEEKKDLAPTDPELADRYEARLDEWRQRQSWIIRQLEALDGPTND